MVPKIDIEWNAVMGSYERLHKQYLQASTNTFRKKWYQ